MTNTSTETGADVGEDDIKDESSVHELECTATSILSKVGTTEMSKHIQEIAPLCSMYDVDVTNMADKREIGFREYLSGKV